MKSLEAIGVLEKDEDKGGRRITQSGQRDLDRESSLTPPLFAGEASVVVWRREREVHEEAAWSCLGKTRY